MRSLIGMSQAQFASALGVSPAQIGYWERGESEPSLAHVEVLCDRLGMSAHWLVLGRGVFAAAEIVDPVDPSSGLRESEAAALLLGLRDEDLLRLVKLRAGVAGESGAPIPPVLQLREPPVQRGGYVEEVVRTYEVRPSPKRPKKKRGTA